MTLLLCAATVLPADARAQIVPVSAKSELTAAAPLETATFTAIQASERIKPVRDKSERVFFALSAGVYAAAALDMHESVSLRPNFVEYDPLAKPLAHLATPAYYVTGIALATGVNLLARRMARSQRWRKVWWVPQACSIAGNTIGFISTKRNE